MTIIHSAHFLNSYHTRQWKQMTWRPQYVVGKTNQGWTVESLRIEDNEINRWAEKKRKIPPVWPKKNDKGMQGYHWKREWRGPESWMGSEHMLKAVHIKERIFPSIEVINW